MLIRGPTGRAASGVVQAAAIGPGVAGGNFLVVGEMLPLEASEFGGFENFRIERVRVLQITLGALA